jgi:hypothetical protein
MLDSPHQRDGLNFRGAIKTNLPSKPLDELDFASMVRSLLEKGSEDNLDESQMMRYLD